MGFPFWVFEISLFLASFVQNIHQGSSYSPIFLVIFMVLVPHLAAGVVNRLFTNIKFPSDLNNSQDSQPIHHDAKIHAS